MNKPQLINYCEFDQYASKAYSLIHNEPQSKNLGDITLVNEKEIADFNWMTWGFPCTDISIAGKQEGLIDKNGGKTRSGLYYDGLRILQEKQPEVSIIENVKNLTLKKFQHIFKSILDDLEKAGYNNYWKVLDAKDYDIPQHRERVYIISIRKDIDNNNFKFPLPITKFKTLEDVLEPDAQLPIIHNIYGGFKETKPRIFNDYSPTIRTAKGGGHIPSVYIIEDFYKNRPIREYIDYSPTLRSERKGLKVINGKDTRQLTTLEAFRLMDFNDNDYIKLKENDYKDTQLYKMAGNSIVVNVLYHIYLELYKAMPYLFEDIKLGSFFSGIGAFEKALDRLYNKYKIN